MRARPAASGERVAEAPSAPEEYPAGRSGKPNPGPEHTTCSCGRSSPCRTAASLVWLWLPRDDHATGGRLAKGANPQNRAYFSRSQSRFFARYDYADVAFTDRTPGRLATPFRERLPRFLQPGPPGDPGGRLPAGGCGVPVSGRPRGRRVWGRGADRADDRGHRDLVAGRVLAATPPLPLGARLPRGRPAPLPHSRGRPRPHARCDEAGHA